jgi:hypothetical protein
MIMMLGVAVLLIYSAYNGNTPFAILKGVVGTPSTKKS